MVQNLAVKVVVTPLLIGGASLAGRRWGPHVGGLLVGLPLTSGPVAFFLATDQGAHFAARAATAMLAGTISQAAFALVYRATARQGWLTPFVAGCTAFAASTLALANLHWTALPTFALVMATLAAAYALTRRPHHAAPTPTDISRPPRWDIPVRMATGTAVVVAITTLAPILGARLAGLLSPFPVFAIVLAVFTHHTHGPREAVAVLDGLVMGLVTAAVFFLTLAVALPALGLLSFGIAAVAALVTQGATMFAIPVTNN